MAIDLDALKKAAAGDPEAKVAVKKKWLAEVHKELVRKKINRDLEDIIYHPAMWGRG